MEPLKWNIYNEAFATKARKELLGEHARVHAKTIYLPYDISPHEWKRLLPKDINLGILSKIPFIDVTTLRDDDRPADTQATPSNSPDSHRSKWIVKSKAIEITDDSESQMDEAQDKSENEIEETPGSLEEEIQEVKA